MREHNDSPGTPLSFARLTGLLRRPPFEPCYSELEFLTPTEYAASFTEAMRLYYRPITYHIARITQDYDGAHDLAQEVFTNLYRARVSFEKAYIYRAAKNAAYSELRRRARQRRLLYTHWTDIRLDRKANSTGEAEAADTRPLPDAALVERASEEALRRAVERLPVQFRVPLVLRAEGKSYRRITEIIGADVGTVKSRICWGKSLLRRRLRAYL